MTSTICAVLEVGLSAATRPYRPDPGRPHCMIILGVDPHKTSHTAAAVDTPATTTIDTLTISSSEADYRRLLDWAQRWPQRYWAIENADGLGHHLAQWLISRGETVVDIPPTATAKIRTL